MYEQATDSAKLAPVQSKAQIYMDHNGSAPTHPNARRAMMPYLAFAYGNPSSGHWAAEKAKQTVENARKSVASLIGAQSNEIVFTSGATEANNMVIKGVFGPNNSAGRHIITSAIEHEAVAKPIRSLKSQGVRTTTVPVDEKGIIDPAAVEDAITPNTGLISIMFANNEIGTIQPIAEIAALAARKNIPFHTDAAQAVGKVPVDVKKLGVDFLSLAGHKFGAPNGIGALYIRSGRKLSPLLHGAGHERGRRAGTESALLAAGLDAAAIAATNKDQSDVRNLRDYFWNCLKQNFGDRVVLNGHALKRVPNTLSVSFPGQVGAEILSAMPHLAATTGSACHAGCIDMSHVLIAMGKSVDIGMGTIRFSLGAENTYEEVDRTIQDLHGILN